jgi:hypothetical protein
MNLKMAKSNQKGASRMEKHNQLKPWYINATQLAQQKKPERRPDSPSLAQVKIQAKVLVPVLRAFRAELGPERANRIAWEALAEWRKEAMRRAPLPSGDPIERFRASTAASAALIGDAVDVEMLKDEPAAIEFNITGCRYAEFFRELGEPELGFALACSWDDTEVEEIGTGEVKLTRTGTIMRGADHCDFRYALKKAART